MNEPVESLYFTWLCGKVMKFDNPTPSLTYWNLLKELHNTEFVWIISGDDNRAADGKDLRLEFYRTTERVRGTELDDLGCSMLEMLIALAHIGEWETAIPEREWFWTFIQTLHLEKFNDTRSFNYAELRQISTILDRLIWRTYKYSGKGGGLFPLNKPNRDQRKLEIWYQFCDFLIERDEQEAV